MKYLKEYNQEWYKTGDCTEDQLKFSDDEGEEIYHWMENLQHIVEDAGFKINISNPYDERERCRQNNWDSNYPNCPVFTIYKKEFKKRQNRRRFTGDNKNIYDYAPARMAENWQPIKIEESKEIMEFLQKMEESFPKYQLKVSNYDSYITMIFSKKLEHIRNENKVFESIKKDDIRDITQSISDMGFDLKINTSWTKPGYAPFLIPDDDGHYRADSRSLTEKSGWNKTYEISMSKRSKSDEIGLNFDDASEVFAEAKVAADRCSELGKVSTSGYLQTDRYGATFFKVELVVITSEKVAISNKDAITKILKKKKYKIYSEDPRYLIIKIQDGYNNTPGAIVKSKDPNKGTSGHHNWDKGRWTYFDWHPKRADIIRERRAKAIEFTSKIKPLLSEFNVNYSYLTINMQTYDVDYSYLKIGIPQKREK